MHTWNVGDFARIIKEGETEYVRVKSLENDVMEATSQTTWETAVYDPATLEYIPPYLIDAELVKKLMRMEVPGDRLYRPQAGRQRHPRVQPGERADQPGLLQGFRDL